MLVLEKMPLGWKGVGTTSEFRKSSTPAALVSVSALYKGQGWSLDEPKAPRRPQSFGGRCPLTARQARERQGVPGTLGAAA